MHRAMSVAEDAWVAALRSGWGQLPLYQDILPLIGSLGSKSESEDLLAIFRTMVRLEPGNIDLLNNYIYLGLIHQVTTPSDAAARLKEMSEKNPEKHELYSALMLAEIMDGRPGDALGHLPNLKKSQRVAPQMKLALEGTAQILNGETDAGSKILSEVPWETLMTQERTIFRELLTRNNKVKLPEILANEPIEQIDPEKIPAWRKAIEKMEKDRAGDILPALPAPRVPGADSGTSAAPPP
jgi:hypothetical protein